MLTGRSLFLAGAVLLLAAPTAAPSFAGFARVGPPSHCAANEQVVFSCRFGKSWGSVCGKDGAVSYRFGRAGKPDIDIASDASFSNVRKGGVVGGGGGQQSRLRFTRDGHHYIVYWGYADSLTDVPGKRSSGIAVMKGDEDLASLKCKGGRGQSIKWDELTSSVPEEDDPRFDTWF